MSGRAVKCSEEKWLERQKLMEQPLAEHPKTILIFGCGVLVFRPVGAVGVGWC